MSTSYPEVFINHERNLTSTEKSVLHLCLLLHQIDTFLEVGVRDDFLQSRRDLSIEIRESLPLQLTGSSEVRPLIVRGFCLATGPYSSFCGCTGDLLLGSSGHMEDDEQNREGEEFGQDVETLEREEEFNGWRDNAQSDT